MKKINLKISTLSVLSLLSSFAVNAQTTIIHAGKILEALIKMSKSSKRWLLKTIKLPQ